MKNQNPFKLFLVTLAILAMYTSTVSADDGVIRFTNVAMKQVVKVDAKGEKTIEYIEPKTAIPGDIIRYDIGFENISNQEVSNIVVNNPIPNNSKYRDNSATGKHTEISFSVDGNTFAEPSKLVLKDNTGKTWLATAEQYKHIRWVYKKPLPPGAKSTVSFMTEIKKPGDD